MSTKSAASHPSMDLPKPVDLRILSAPAFRWRENPYHYALYTAVAAQGVQVDDFTWPRFAFGSYHFLHLHWPEATIVGNRKYLRPFRIAVFALLLSLTRLRGTRIVWTAHNLRPHGLSQERRSRLYEWLSRRVDGLIHLTLAAKQDFEREYPITRSKPSTVIAHGTYENLYPNGIDRDRARDQLSLNRDAVVVGFVGRISKYKNVPALIGAFKQIQDSSVQLLIAGRPLTPQDRELIARLAVDDSRIVTFLEHVADDRMQVFLNACNVICLPFRNEILNSGSVILCLSFGIPVMCPAKGSIQELQSVVGQEWIRTYSGDFNSRLLADAIAWSKVPRSSSPNMESMQWQEIARQTISMYRRLLAPHDSRQPNDDAGALSRQDPAANRPVDAV